MNIYLVSIILISLIGIKFYIKNNNEEYISIDNSSCIKGIFILIVFASHIMQYAIYDKPIDKVSVDLIIKLGQLMVTLFFFYSGYGVYQSIKNKGNGYVKNIPKKRILNTLINFDICVLLYFIIYMIFEKDFEITRFILSLIGWDGYGNSNWYIFCILILYFITFITFTILKKEKYNMIAMWIFTLFFYLLLSISKDSYWYNTLFCYPLGMTFAYFKDKIDKVLNNNIRYIIILIVTLIINIILGIYSDNIIVYDIMSCTFCILVVLLSMRIDFNSKILLWFGNNLFWIYILQRLPMIVFTYLKLNSRPYKFFILCFIFTVILTFIVNFIKKHQKILN